MRTHRQDGPRARAPRRLFTARVVDPRRARSSGGSSGRFPRGDGMSILTAALLAPVECAELAARVRAHERQWTRRSANAFFTLGAASYLDDPAFYLERASATNPLLEAAFCDLHERVRAALSEKLDAPCVFATPFALPGFHIWRVPGIPTRAEASLHFDMQY